MDYEKEFKQVEKILQQVYEGRKYWFEPELINETIKAMKLVKESDSLPCVSMIDFYGELRMLGLSCDNCDKIIEWSKTL